MTSGKGENVVAPNWAREYTGFPVNSPDVNDVTGPVRTTSGYSWDGGSPSASPDGGSWQNVIGKEDFSQTISGLTIGTTYYFRYYYCTQGIAESNGIGVYRTPNIPRVTITGATGYNEPSNAGFLFSWNTYYCALVATSTSITITAGGGTNAYIAYDGFYLSLTPLPLPLITLPPQNTSVCATGTTEFSVQASGVTGYQWQFNNGTGWQNVTDNVQYAGSRQNRLQISNVSATMNGYQYRCMLSSACCQTYSSLATLTVTIPVLPTVTISTPAPAICTGASAVFTAQIANAGTSSDFKWLKNGLTVGGNSNTYADNTLIDGDVIQCELTSTINCSSAVHASSNKIVVTVNSILLPAISIQPSGNNICDGTLVNFKATTTAGGASPGYKWAKNGVEVGTQGDVYTDNALKNGDMIQCVLSSNYACATANTASSNIVTMQVMPRITSSVNITANLTKICAGSTATFTATPSNGGTTPIYQWKKNNIDVGINASTYSVSDLKDGDVVTCILTPDPSINCLTAPTSISNAVRITVTPNPVVRLNKDSRLCNGTTRILDAGQLTNYLWNDGSTSRTLEISRIGKYYVTVTDINNCIGSDTTMITTILPVPDNFLSPDTAICSYGTAKLLSTGSYDQYHWNTGASGTTIQVKAPGVYWLEVTDNNQCTGRETVIVSFKDCPQGFYIPNAFSPNGDGRNDTFKPLLYGNIRNYKFQIYNRWGELMFQTLNPLMGWDGMRSGAVQGTGAFYWFCTYQLEGEAATVKRGSVILVR